MEPDPEMLDEPTTTSTSKPWAGSRNRLQTLPARSRPFPTTGPSQFHLHRNPLKSATAGSVAILGTSRVTHQKAEREAQHLAAYRNQQREIAHHEDFIRRFRPRHPKPPSPGPDQILDVMNESIRPRNPMPPLPSPFPQPPRSGQRVATLGEVRQAYGDHLVYSDLSLEVEKQERIALVGPNGAGKSTLLKILAELVPIEGGKRELGHNVSVGYFSQQRVEVLNLERSVVDEATADTDPMVREQDARTLLGAFLGETTY